LTGHPTGLTREFASTQLGLFDLPVELKKLDSESCYKMLERYLVFARRRSIFEHLSNLLNKVNPFPKGSLQYENPKSIAPFTTETARLLCARSDGVPRYLNRLGNFVLLKACHLGAYTIDHTTLQFGFEYADQRLRTQTKLDEADRAVLELLLEKGTLSDAAITLPDLQRFDLREFSELVPILEKLVDVDFARRRPSERAAEYELSPLLLRKSV
jgi:hypothetical protein